MKKRLKRVPKFRTEADERAFWESPERNSAEFIDWSQAKRVVFPNLKRPTRNNSLRRPAP
ncbi:MAG: CopG family antitoxin [Steroidobacteraceae bacterium]